MPGQVDLQRSEIEQGGVKSFFILSCCFRLFLIAVISGLRYMMGTLNVFIRLQSYRNVRMYECTMHDCVSFETGINTIVPA